MPLADLPAGDGLAGDETDPLIMTAVPVAPRALRFNPLTRDFDRDSDGRYVELHPVDSEVVLALTIEFQRIASAPTTGNTYRRIRNAFASDIDADVRARTRAALSRPIARGDVTLVKVERETRPDGALLIAVHYVNERLVPRQVQTQRIPFG